MEAVIVCSLVHFCALLGHRELLREFYKTSVIITVHQFVHLRNQEDTCLFLQQRKLKGCNSQSHA